MSFPQDLKDKIKSHMNWNDEKVQLWISTENPLLGECTPDHYYKMRPEKCIKFVLNLIDENTKPAS